MIITVALAVYLVVKKRARRFEISIVALMALKYASILVLAIGFIVNQTPNYAYLILSSTTLASSLTAHLVYAS